jgi:alkylation response protein AidB-like acyl-CoA dehydrogenase
MAVMAAEVAAAIRSAEAGLAGLGGERETDEIAQAKVRVGESVGVVAELAQQVHGAMGYTHEHRLHHCTRRLWAWRDEYGTEQEWQERLGRRIARLADDQGIDAVWQFVASRG